MTLSDEWEVDNPFTCKWCVSTHHLHVCDPQIHLEYKICVGTLLAPSCPFVAMREEMMELSHVTKPLRRATTVGSRTARCAFVAIVLSTPFLQGAKCVNPDTIVKPITKTIDKINATMQKAIDTLDTQSTLWQQTITTLEQDLAAEAKSLSKDVQNLEHQFFQDVNTLVNNVSYLVKDGGQWLQESANCQKDIYSSHAKIALQNMLNEFLNKHNYLKKNDRPKLPFAPIICSANPTSVAVGQWQPSQSLALSGVDMNLFKTQPPSVLVLRSDGSTIEAKNMGNQGTNYHFTINIQTMISQGLLDDAIQIQVNWNGHKVNSNQIPVIACGRLSAPCCQGKMCKSGTCVDQICLPCGQLNQHCCNGVNCSSGVCTNDMCTSCGGKGQICCAGKSCTESGTVCKQGTCIVPPVPPEEVRTIEAIVKTGGMDGAGTNDVVDLFLGGNSWRLNVPGKNDFERNHTDSFVLTAPSKMVWNTDLNPVRIRKGADGENGEWYVESLVVKINGKHTCTLPVNKWLKGSSLVWTGTLPASGSCNPPPAQ